jgi:ketosteroid isomerase-like protein
MPTHPEGVEGGLVADTGTSSPLAGLGPAQIVGRIFAALDGGDVQGLAAMMDDNVRLQLANAEESHGKERFVAAVEAFLVSVAGFRHEILDVWHDGETIVAELHVHYTRLDGDKVTIPCCNVFQVGDDLVWSYRSYLDMAPVYA